MKSLTPIHIRRLLRLCESYGQEAFVSACKRAQHNAHDAHECGFEHDQAAEPPGLEAE